MRKNEHDYQIKRISLVDAVVAQMLRAVADGYFSVGEKIPSEKVLMQEFDVSRSTLREAFKKLESLGVLSIRQGCGTVLLQDDITQLNLPSDIDYVNAQSAVQKVFQLENCKLSHYLEAREALEAASFEAACERALPRDILAVEEALEKHKAIVENGESEKLFTVDLLFHGSIVNASKNEFYQQFWEFLTPYFRTQISRVCMIPGMIDNAYKVHEKIYQALVSGDVSGGKFMIGEHIGTISGRMLSKAREEYLSKKADFGRE